MRSAITRYARQVLEDSATSGWLRDALRSALERDPIEAAHDADLLPLRFLDARDPRLSSCVDAIANALGHDGWIYRYRSDDGLGRPEVAFVICTFWMIEALAMTGRREQARAALETVCRTLTPLGLMAEDCDTQAARMWGNFPQAYSHVGLIHAAFAASPGWSQTQ